MKLPRRGKQHGELVGAEIHRYDTARRRGLLPLRGGGAGQSERGKQRGADQRLPGEAARFGAPRGPAQASRPGAFLLCSACHSADPRLPKPRFLEPPALLSRVASFVQHMDTANGALVMRWNLSFAPERGTAGFASKWPCYATPENMPKNSTRIEPSTRVQRQKDNLRLNKEKIL